MPLPFGETISVIRQTENQFGDWAPGLTYEIPGCAVWPTTGTETIAGGMDVVVYGLTVLVPPDSQVQVLSTDKVTVRGTLYWVNGEPTMHMSPLTGTKAGVQVLLKAYTG
jgi:hypothetical protein